jgi:hypothetical protein
MVYFEPDGNGHKNGKIEKGKKACGVLRDPLFW